MSTILDHWTELAQGGRLLDRKALDSLPDPRVLHFGFADRLRDSLTLLPPDKAARGEALSQLLDFVLEDVCGLAVGWAKGPGVDAAHAEKLIDGTELKPRRLLTRDGQQVLAVFTTPAERVGLHQGRRPVAHAVEYLRRRKIALGLVTNGHDWRLIFADADNLAWVQWAAERWLDGDGLHPSLQLLRRVLTLETLSPAKDGEPSPLVDAIRATRRGQAKLSAELGEGVRAAVELLLRSRRPVLDPVWASHDPKSVYVAACHFVMRLVVVLFAEGRELLPVDSPVYHHAYGLRGLMEALERVGVDRRRGRSSAWPRLLALFRLLHGGSLHPQLLVTAYGGDLFRGGDASGDAVQRALTVLEGTSEPPDDDIVHKVLVLLTRTTERVREGAGWRVVAAPVDFTELTSEYIGILYEGLLDYELHRAGAEPIVFLGLGDQPALPLDRLEQMEDKQLAALVEKAKVKRATSDAEEGEEEEDEGDEEQETEAQADAPEGGAAAELEALLPVDDERAQARARALRWAERAAIAGKLIKAPKGAAGRNDPAWKAQVEATANLLVVDLKLPGELYLVRWGGTRKGAGTFYTRPQLTLPTVRRTLEPLLVQADGTIRKPEELLGLKICDPAMGSGSFLVAAIRVLTEAVVKSLHVHGRVRLNGDRVRLDCELMPEADRDQPEDRVEAIVRRAVVEHCVYGVDIDPLAVELARVALWVETLDSRLPFTFLDHKLRCGDSLVGTWLDRFRDYPLLAWWRQSPDEKWKGVAHVGEPWTQALKVKRAEMVKEQADLLTGQKNWLTSSVSDADLKVAIDRVRELYRCLHKVPASQPDKRAEIWRTQVRPDPALAKVRDAFDAWCALWFWPLDRLSAAPGPASLAAPSENGREIVRGLREKLRFFHWELEFPDVFTEKGAGFDAIVANPPWEVRKPSSKEFFSDRDPLYRSYGKQDALAWQRLEFRKDPSFEQEWLRYKGELKDAGNFIRNAGEPFGDAEDAQGHQLVGLAPRKADATKRLHKRWSASRALNVGLCDPSHPFRHQGSADLNSYKLFVEVVRALLRPSGQFGILTPSGLYTDKGSTGLRHLLLEQCAWRWLFGFENRERIFDIHPSFKFAVIIAAKGGKTSKLRVSFMRRVVDDWGECAGVFEYPVDAAKEMSPDDLALVEFVGEEEMALAFRISASNPRFLEAVLGWNARYFCDEFHTSKDSALFPPIGQWLARGFVGGERALWKNGEEVALPLYEGRMLGAFDFCAKGWVSGKGRGAKWREVPWSEKVVEPQFLMSREDALLSGNYGPLPGPRLAFKDITSATNARSAIAALLVRKPCCHTAPFLRLGDGDLQSTLALSAVLNSFAFDYLLRLRLGGLHLTWNFLSAVPALSVNDALALVPSAALLGLADWQFSPEWLELRPTATASPNWALTKHERLRLRVVIDAIVFKLYGFSREDVRWILRDCDHPSTMVADNSFSRTLPAKGFWRVDKELDPELRHTVLAIVAFDALESHIVTQGGDRNRGINAFLNLNNGAGWLLPEAIRLCEFGLGSDERASVKQVLAGRLGPRFLDWQLTLSEGAYWAECERCAIEILGNTNSQRGHGGGGPSQVEGIAVGGQTAAGGQPTTQQPKVNLDPKQKTLFE